MSGIKEANGAVQQPEELKPVQEQTQAQAAEPGTTVIPLDAVGREMSIWADFFRNRALTNASLLRDAERLIEQQQLAMAAQRKH